MHKLTLPDFEKNKRTLYFEKGTNPFFHLDIINFFYFIKSGKIKVFDINFKTGKEQILYILSVGDMFDIKSLLNKEPFKYSLEVIEDVEMIEIPSSDVHHMIETNDKFKEYFYSYISNQLNYVENLVIDISLHTVYERMIHLFYNFAKKSTDKINTSVLNNLTQDDLAAMIGTVRKVFNKNLKKMKNEHLIEVKRKNITINDELLD